MTSHHVLKRFQLCGRSLSTVDTTHAGVTVSILIPMKRFFTDFPSETGGSYFLHFPEGSGAETRQPPSPRCFWKESLRKRVILSDGIAKEIPAATFRVLIPITSPSFGMTEQSEGQ